MRSGVSARKLLRGMLLALACTSAVGHTQEPARHGLWQRAHPLAVEGGVLTVNGMDREKRV